MDKVSYALGLGIGRQLSDMGAKSHEALMISLRPSKTLSPAKNHRSATRKRKQSYRSFSRNRKKKQRAAAAEKFKDAKENGEKYLADNAKKEGVVTLPAVCNIRY